MTFSAVMKALEEAGTAQARKTYARHGAGKNVFGVGFADLRRLHQQIKTDHDLARQLWASCNLEAQWLATMIADPAQMNAMETDAWAKHIAAHEALLGAHLAAVVARNACADEKMREWINSTEEFVRASGYNILIERLKNGDTTLSDAECRERLRTIEKEIHSSANRARYSMIGAVIAIGTYRRPLTREALAAAKRIGKVHVDHGDTACKTPDAVSHIQKAVARGTA